MKIQFSVRTRTRTEFWTSAPISRIVQESRVQNGLAVILSPIPRPPSPSTRTPTRASRTISLRILTVSSPFRRSVSAFGRKFGRPRRVSLVGPSETLLIDDGTWPWAPGRGSLSAEFDGPRTRKVVKIHFRLRCSPRGRRVFGLKTRPKDLINAHLEGFFSAFRSAYNCFLHA